MELIKKTKLSLLTASLLLGLNSWGADVTITNDGVADSASSGNNVGQSFQATKTGILKSIAVASFSVASNTLKVYSGAGTSGSLLHTQSVNFTKTVTDTSTYSFFTITLDSTVNVTSGSTYTFSFPDGTDQLLYDSNGYGSGTIYLGAAANAGLDLKFQVVQADAAPATDSTGTLTASATVNEASMISIPTTANTLAEKVNVFDFTITDLGTSDGLSTDVTQIVLNTSGTGDFSKMKWLLSGNDLSDINGSYDSGANTITFSDLNISVADGTNETYTLSAYFQNPTGLTDNSTFGFSINGSSDITVDTSKSTMASGQSAITNSTNAKVDVTATKLIFKTMPSN